MTQPIGSGAPTPVQGVTGGPGIPSGVGGVEQPSGNVVFTPPSNTFQLRKGSSPQALQVYEFYNSPTDNVRIELAAATGGPEFIGVRAAPSGVVRVLIVGSTGNIQIAPSNTGTPIIISTTSFTLPVGTVLVAPNGVQTGNTTVAGNSLFSGNGAPLVGLGANGDFYFNTAGAALTTIYQKRAGAWVGIV